jgi:hypothetical protein
MGCLGFVEKSKNVYLEVSLQRPEVGLAKLNKVLFGHMLTYDLNLKAS